MMVMMMILQVIGADFGDAFFLLLLMQFAVMPLKIL